MSRTLRDLRVLVQLRLKLLLRWNLTRYTRNARLAAPMRLGLIVLIVIWLVTILVFPLTAILRSAVFGPGGRALLQTYLAWGASVAFVLVFFYAVVSLVGTLTYRSDLKLLLLTPMSPVVIMGEKVLAVSFGFSLLFVSSLPALLAAGNVLHLGPLYLIAAVLMLLVMPVAPVSLALLVVLGVLRWLPPARGRTVSPILGALLGATFFIVTQLFSSARALSQRPSPPPSLPNALPSAWPGHVLGALALGHPGTAAAYLVATGGLTAALFALATGLSARLFSRGWANYQEVGRRKRPVDPAPQQVEPGTGGVVRPHPEPGDLSLPSWWPLLYKEWLTLRRDPQRLVQMAYPLIFVGFYAYRIFAARSSFGSDSGSDTSGFIDLSLYIMLTFTTIFMLSSIAPPIVNREGRSLYLLALSPVTSNKILLSKWIICAVPVLVIAECLLVAGTLILQIEPVHALVTAVALIGLVVALAGMVISINLIWPRLGSDNPRRQASGIASVVSLIGEFVVGSCFCLLLVLTFNLWPHLPLLSLAAGLVLVLLTGAITGMASLVGPRLLQRLLTRG